MCKLDNRSRSPRWALAVAASLVVANLFLHKSISDVCDALFARIGRGPYERLMLLGIAALSAGGGLVLLRGHASALRRWRPAAALLVLAAATVWAQHWLLVSNVELIHFPQFGLLAALLLVAGLPPQAAWVGATLAGVIDETYQHLVIYAHVAGTYFDYNDVVLNAIGAAWAVVLAGHAGPALEAAWLRRWLRAALAALCVALALALWLAPPRVAAIDVFPFWRPALSRAATGLDYHVMSASEGIGALVLLWGLVAVATRSPRARPTPIAISAAMLLAGLCLGCRAYAPPGGRVDPPDRPPAVAIAATAAAPAADPVTKPTVPFIITFWCGPPLAELTDTRAAEIAAAGFNVVGAPCEGAVNSELNHQALDVAGRHGLTLWITDPRIDQTHDLPDEWEALLAGAVADYGGHPALGGYFLVDEPGADRFADLAKVVARLQAIDPGHVPYVNLLPDFATPDGLGTASYRDYVEQFVAVVRPPLLSFDYYPFKADTDRATFFDNLSLVRSLAREYGLPFLLIVQAMPHGPYRDPSAAELAWQINHAVAFGAGGISYFAYWTPVNVVDAERWHFRRGLVEAGQPTDHFHDAARLNRDARAYAEQLNGLRSIAVADSAGRFGSPLPIGPIAAIDGGPVTAGFFLGTDALAVVLVNQDYKTEREVTLRLGDGAGKPQAFDVGSGRWHRLRHPTLTLAPGGAHLLRWTRGVVYSPLRQR